MPELPEVETVVRGLRKTVAGWTIKSVRVNAPEKSIEISRSFKQRSFASVLTNKTIEKIDRRGKNILMYLTGDVVLWVHLKMTGRFLIQNEDVACAKHDLVTFGLTNNANSTKDKLCLFNDYRRFGRLRLYPLSEVFEQDGLRTLGPEPFDITANDFADLCRSRSRMIKPALLDQSFVAGMGNIYTDEALFASKLHPERVSSSISRRKLIELHGHMVRLLNLAIKNAGTTVDSYSGVGGKPGSFQKYLLAYNNEGNPCSRCGRKIVRKKIGSRSAHFCPKCQTI